MVAIQIKFNITDAAPDITQFNNTRHAADRVTRYVNVSQTDLGESDTNGRWKVSAKIQQLLNTLKRPKRRPLPEFYEDNDIELEIAANPKDPNAPKPEGSIMTAVQGEQLAVAAGLPRTLEAALQRYGANSFKSPMATVLDPNGKITTTITYGKLLSRAQKIAYALSTKIFSKGPEQITLKPGDRVALVYPNNDPLRFTSCYRFFTLYCNCNIILNLQFHYRLVWLHVSWSSTIANRVAALQL